MSMSTIFVNSEYPSFCGQMCQDENGQIWRHRWLKYILATSVGVNLFRECQFKVNSRSNKPGQRPVMTSRPADDVIIENFKIMRSWLESIRNGL